MYVSHSTLTLLTLLASHTLALPHDDHPTHAKHTRTVVITITHTLEEESPFPTQPMDSVFTWPSQTTSLAVPSLTLDPLNTTPPPAPTSTPTHNEPLASKKADSDVAVPPQATTSSAETPTLDPAAWTGMDGALMTTSKSKRSDAIDQESGAELRRKVSWAKMFAIAHPTRGQIVRDEDEDEKYHRRQKEDCEGGCVECEKGGDIVCVNRTQFGYCDEGCAEVRGLGEGMECVDGTVFGARG